MASEKKCSSSNHEGRSHWSRPNMLRLYVRTNTTVPDPKDKWGRGKVKRSWDPVGYMCTDPKCKHVELDEAKE